MNKNELQEIKDYWCRDTINYSLAGRTQRDIHCLITALEAARADLAEAKELYDIAEEGRVLFMNQLGKLIPEHASERMVDLLREIADLRKQLDEAKYDLRVTDKWWEKAIVERDKLHDERIDLRKQLADARTDADSCEKRVDKLTDELAASQAECERLHTENASHREILRGEGRKWWFKQLDYR